MKIITRFLSAVLALCLLTSLCLPARAAGTQDCGAKLLAITFDDGPGKYTGALLDGLAERGVHATFFVNGVNASGWPETLKRIVNEGHQLANHTYNHKNLNTCSAQTVAYEISAVQALITAAGGDENAYIRAPYGNANKTVKSVVTAPLIYWSVDPEDWKYRNAETVRSNIESGVFDGAIILVHDIYKTSVDGALAAIDDLMAEGYEFVTVKDLLLRRGVSFEIGRAARRNARGGDGLLLGKEQRHQSACRRRRGAGVRREPNRDALGLRCHEDLSGLWLDDADGHGRVEAQRIRYAGGICRRSCPIRGYPYALPDRRCVVLFGC